MKPDNYIVLCREDRRASGEKGDYTLATRKTFEKRSDAEEYTKAISASREPVIAVVVWNGGARFLSAIKNKCIHGEYPSIEAVLVRAKTLASHVFGRELNFRTQAADRYGDAELEIEHCISIYWNDDTRIPVDNILVPGFQISATVYNPGVWRYRDGSGEPPSVDYEDIGKPYANLEDALIEAFKLVVDIQLKDFLVGEYEAKVAQETEELEKHGW